MAAIPCYSLPAHCHTTPFTDFLQCFAASHAAEEAGEAPAAAAEEDGATALEALHNVGTFAQVWNG